MASTITRPAKPAALDTTERYAATGTGAPTYTSGAQKWNGTAATLKAKPAMVRTTPTVATGERIAGSSSAVAMRSRWTAPVTP